MKIIFIITILFYSLSSYTQNYDNNWPKNENGEIEYVSLVDVPNTDAKTLFGNARMYFADVFVSFEDATRNLDEVNNQLFIKGNFVINTKTMGQMWKHRIWFSLALYCKDNKYKLIIKPTTHCYQVYTSSGAKLAGNPTGSFSHYYGKEYCYGDLRNSEPVCAKMVLNKKIWNEEVKPAIEQYINSSINSLHKAMNSTTQNDW